MRNYDDYSMSFLEYLNEYNDDDVPMHTYTILLSRNQYAMLVDCGPAHDDMVSRLLRKCRPNMVVNQSGIPLDSNDTYVDDTFFLLGYKDYMHIELMNLKELSQEQYDCLSEILYYIKGYNDKHNNKFKLNILGNDYNGIKYGEYQDKIPEVLEKLEKCVRPVALPADEVIIGRKIVDDKKVTKESIDTLVEKMANNEVDTNGFEFAGTMKDHIKSNIKGYGSIAIIAILSTLISIEVLLLGMFLLK